MLTIRTRPQASVVVPKVLEPRWRKLGVSHRVLNVPVPQIGLERARIDAAIGELKPAGMAQLMWVHRRLEAGSDAKPGNHFAHAGGRKR